MSVLIFQLSVGRKLMVSSPAPPPMGDEHTWRYVNNGTVDSDISVILAALLCALICALVINWVFTCTRFYSSEMTTDSFDEESIRLVKTGLRRAAIKTLPVVVYTSASKGFTGDCSICLTEFGKGEKVRVLPNCSHGFHMECIDKWLFSHTSCPMCRHSLNLFSPNRNPRGSPIAEATESNCNAMPVDMEITDSSQVILPRAIRLERTPPEASEVSTSLPFPQSPISENQRSCDPMNNVS